MASDLGESLILDGSSIKAAVASEVGAPDIRREHAQDRLRELNLTGRPIDFQQGVARSTLRAHKWISFENPLRRGHDLAGVAGRVIGAEAGSVLGRKVRKPDEVVLFVRTKASLSPFKLPHDYVVFGSEAEFSVGGPRQ